MINLSVAVIKMILDFQGIDAGNRQRLRTERIQNYPIHLFRGTDIPFYSIKDEISKIDSTELFQIGNFHKADFPSFEHHQLRHLVSCVSNSAVFYTTLNKIKCFNSITGQSDVFLDLIKMQKDHLRITALCATDEYAIFGGLMGDYLCKPFRGQLSGGNFTYSRNGITNHLKPVLTRSGEKQCLVASNDFWVRSLSMDTLTLKNILATDWSPNCIALCPDLRSIAIVGDSLETIIVDSCTGKVLEKLSGHIDFSFACDWSSDGRIIATGSQDKTTRLYDARFMRKAFSVIPAKMSAIRSVQFNSFGNLLSIAESADFVHLVQPVSNIMQTIDFFGAISGCSFNLDSNSLFVGIADSYFGGVLELSQRNFLQRWGLD